MLPTTKKWIFFSSLVVVIVVAHQLVFPGVDLGERYVTDPIFDLLFVEDFDEQEKFTQAREFAPLYAGEGVELIEEVYHPAQFDRFGFYVARYRVLSQSNLESMWTFYDSLYFPEDGWIKREWKADEGQLVPRIHYTRNRVGAHKDRVKLRLSGEASDHVEVVVVRGEWP